MATKLNVPLFDESVSLSNPSGAVMKFIGMAGGASLAIAAIGVGQYIVNRAGDAAGADDDQFEVI